MRARASLPVDNHGWTNCTRVIYSFYMEKNRKPKRYYNIRVDEETYKILYRVKKKTDRKIIDIVRDFCTT